MISPRMNPVGWEFLSLCIRRSLKEQPAPMLKRLLWVGEMASSEALADRRHEYPIGNVHMPTGER